MKILWCEIHAMSEQGEGLCMYGRELSRMSGLIAGCRMVPMRLISDDALIGEKVWWCLEHAASFEMEADLNPPTWGCWYTEGYTGAQNCRMVERILTT